MKINYLGDSTSHQKLGNCLLILCRHMKTLNTQYKWLEQIGHTYVSDMMPISQDYVISVFLAIFFW